MQCVDYIGSESHFLLSNYFGSDSGVLYNGTIIAILPTRTGSAKEELWVAFLDTVFPRIIAVP